MANRNSMLLASVIIAVVINIQVSPAAPNSMGSNSTGSNANSALPAITERAANLNSRYLSAGSTASLAAATVAAAANQQQQQTGGPPSPTSQLNVASGPQSGPAHQQHQHQHHQQQQQQVHPTAAPAQASNQQQLSLASNPTQYSSLTQQQPQQLVQPPVMSSTFGYNPASGQYSTIGQADLNQVQAQQQQQQQNGPLQFQAPVLGISNQQAGFGAPLGQFPVSYQPNTFLPARQARPPLSFPFGSVGPLILQQQQQQPPRFYQSSYTRRTGLAAGGSRPQVGSNQNFLGVGGGGGVNVEDENPNSFPQQQSGGATLADQLAASLGLNLDTSYLNSLPSPSNVYLQQQQNSNHHQLIDYLGQSGPSNSPFSATTSGGAGIQSMNPAHNNLFNGAVTASQQVAASSSASDQQCIAADGRHGTCYQASECIKRGGTPMGRCGGGGGNHFDALNLGGQNSQSSVVCCLFDVTCGQFAAERFVYFRNPGYPSNSYDQSRMCRAKIGKLDKGVCQFRLDMIRFDIAKPSNGNCSQDMFVVSGQNENYVIPKVCGFNDGQHYYVGVDESGVITLHMMMMGYYRRHFEILVTQIPCRSDFGAPAHCLQYFVGTHGTIKSFNYVDHELDPYLGSPPGGSSSSLVQYDLQQDGSSSLASSNAGAPYGLQIQQQQQQQQQQQLRSPMFAQAQMQAQTPNRLLFNQQDQLQQFGGYPNDLDYTICIRKESGFCSVSYQLSRLADQQAASGYASGPQLAPFGVGQVGGPSSSWANETQLGSGISTDCRDDYLLIGGVRLCSGQGSAQWSSWSSNEPYQNGSAFGGAAMQQQLQNQQTLLLQQLARIQQQQANASSALNSNNNQLFAPGSQRADLNPVGQQQAMNGLSNNLEQQQAAVVQQLMLVQQHLSNLASVGQQQSQYGPFQQPDSVAGALNELQAAAIITDNTSGPFLLRFVSNNARNARGFQIDYRQNPCK